MKPQSEGNTHGRLSALWPLTWFNTASMICGCTPRSAMRVAAVRRRSWSVHSSFSLTLTGVAGIYNRSAYSKEKREALELWANRLRVIVAKASGANVTTLKPKRA